MNQKFLARFVKSGVWSYKVQMHWWLLFTNLFVLDIIIFDDLFIIAWLGIT